MIYLFTWNSPYLVRQKTLDWKKKFIEKNGDFNLSHIKEIEKMDNNDLSQELLSNSFLGWKKLIIIEDIPTSSSSKQNQEKQDFLYELLEQIPQDNIVLFSSSNPDKRSKFYKKLKKIATKIEEFNTTWEADLFNIIQKKYNWKIDRRAINLIIKYKANNLEKIISEIEKLLINYDFISTDIIKENIFPELEESIFQLIDDIMNLNIKNALEKINIILSQTNVYAFYNNLLANLRILVFIQKLKSSPSPPLKGGIKSVSEILDLKNRSFLVNKNYKIDFDKLQNLYIWLINLDKKMKSGKMIASEDDVLKYEIEKEILKLNL